uniref:Uncharacterized protein n=1 Tax=Strombidium rassoulzadegani TaxID=1082188 RepID=A0A7S3CU31_9SPIT|mmetsp:Transcript_9284/g.15624  ORF Transcript_9284/g.15624 Transcript_9284/m.15624 type:complete len:281 (+) Transcript_9284:40-882(+)
MFANLMQPMDMPSFAPTPLPFELPPLFPSFGKPDEMPTDKPQCPFQAFFNGLFNPQEPEPCVLNEEDTYADDNVFMREFGRTAYKSVLRGMYKSEELPITDECFGEWMQEPMETVSSLMDLAFDDPFEISVKYAKDVSNKLIDAHAKMHKTCMFKTVYDEANDWCIDNIDMCLGSDDKMVSRLMTHGWGLIPKVSELFNFVFFTSDCISDKDFIQEMGRIIEDFTSIFSLLFGVELVHDPSVKPIHYSQTKLNEIFDEYYANQTQIAQELPSLDYFGAMW